MFYVSVIDGGEPGEAPEGRLNGLLAEGGDRVKTIALADELVGAARQLGRDGVLLDPSDGEILTAAAELVGYPPGRLTRAEQEEIVGAWEAGNEVYRQPLIDASLAEYDEDGVQTVFPISPFGASETRAERIARWEAMGSLDPDCSACREFYEHPTLSPFAPSHYTTPVCRSGRRPHCTCPTCWG